MDGTGNHRNTTAMELWDTHPQQQYDGSSRPVGLSAVLGEYVVALFGDYSSLQTSNLRNNIMPV